MHLSQICADSRRPARTMDLLFQSHTRQTRSHGHMVGVSDLCHYRETPVCDLTRDMSPSVYHHPASPYVINDPRASSLNPLVGTVEKRSNEKKPLALNQRLCGMRMDYFAIL